MVTVTASPAREQTNEPFAANAQATTFLSDVATSLHLPIRCRVILVTHVLTTLPPIFSQSSRRRRMIS